MNFEAPQPQENTSPIKIEIEPGFDEFIPADFKDNPLKYFAELGVNIKSGVVQYDKNGLVKEDPTAVKTLPVWFNSKGEELKVVAKRVNTKKSQVEKTGDPFYEYSIMEIAKEFGLPAPVPIARVEQDGSHLIVMSKIEGITWTDEGRRPIREANLSDEQKQDLLRQAQVLMDDLQKRFEEIGLIRTWKLKDMVFSIDLETKKINIIIPTDWERTKIDKQKLELARSKRQ